MTVRLGYDIVDAVGYVSLGRVILARVEAALCQFFDYLPTEPSCCGRSRMQPEGRLLRKPRSGVGQWRPPDPYVPDASEAAPSSREEDPVAAGSRSPTTYFLRQLEMELEVCRAIAGVPYRDGST